MERFEVEFYETPSGLFPAEEFIFSQDNKMQAKLYHLIELLELEGSDLREPYSKYLGDGIFELRAKQGGRAARVLYFFVVGKRVILTNGFMKKTRKTPAKELEKARRYRNDFFKQAGSEHHD